MTQIESNVPAPEEKPKKSRARKQAASKIEKKPNPAEGLIAALKFVAPAQRKVGPVGQQFCMISGGWVAASDGILTIAAPVTEDLSACPHTSLLLDALNGVGDDMQITQISANTLAVTSGDFRGLVPCVGMSEIVINGPDEPIADINDNIKAALGAVVGLTIENSPNFMFSSVNLKSGSAVATNGHAALEYWHGVDLPSLLIPRAAAMLLSKCKGTLKRFGFSPSSATFWFEDGSFIKTQLFEGNYPDMNVVLSKVNCGELWKVPPQFFEGVRRVEAFNEKGYVYFSNGRIMSGMNVDESSSFVVPNLPDEFAFDSKLLLAVEDAFVNVYFSETTSKAVFENGNIRGAVMGLNVYQLQREQAQDSGTYTGDNMDDDIPF